MPKDKKKGSFGYRLLKAFIIFMAIFSIGSVLITGSNNVIGDDKKPDAPNSPKYEEITIDNKVDSNDQISNLYQYYLLTAGGMQLSPSQTDLQLPVVGAVGIPNLGYGGIKLNYSMGEFESVMGTSSSQKKKDATHLQARTLRSFYDYGYLNNLNGGVGAGIMVKLTQTIVGVFYMIFALANWGLFIIENAIISFMKAFDVLGMISNVLTKGTLNNNFFKTAGLKPEHIKMFYNLALLVLSALIGISIARMLGRSDRIDTKHRNRLFQRVAMFVAGVALLSTLSSLTAMLNSAADKHGQTQLLETSPLVNIKRWAEFDNMDPQDLGDLKVSDDGKHLDSFNPLKDTGRKKIADLNGKTVAKNQGANQSSYTPNYQIADIMAYMSHASYSVNDYYGWIASPENKHGYGEFLKNKSTYGTDLYDLNQGLGANGAFTITVPTSFVKFLENGGEYSAVTGAFRKSVIPDNKVNLSNSMSQSDFWLKRFYYGSWKNAPGPYHDGKTLPSFESVVNWQAPHSQNEPGITHHAMFSNESMSYVLQTSRKSTDSYTFMMTNVTPGPGVQAQQIFSTDVAEHAEVASIGGSGIVGILVVSNTLLATLLSIVFKLLTIMAVVEIGILVIAVEAPKAFFKSVALGDFYLFGASAVLLIGFYLTLVWLIYAPTVIMNVINGFTSGVTDETVNQLTKFNSGLSQTADSTLLLAFSMKLIIIVIIIFALFKSEKLRNGIIDMLVFPINRASEIAKRLQMRSMARNGGGGTDGANIAMAESVMSSMDKITNSKTGTTNNTSSGANSAVPKQNDKVKEMETDENGNPISKKDNSNDRKANNETDVKNMNVDENGNPIQNKETEKPDENDIEQRNDGDDTEQAGGEPVNKDTERMDENKIDNGTDEPDNGTDEPDNGTDEPDNGTDEPDNGTDEDASNENNNRSIQKDASEMDENTIVDRYGNPIVPEKDNEQSSDNSENSQKNGGISKDEPQSDTNTNENDESSQNANKGQNKNDNEPQATPRTNGKTKEMVEPNSKQKPSDDKTQPKPQATPQPNSKAKEMKRPKPRVNNEKMQQVKNAKKENRKNMASTIANGFVYGGGGKKLSGQVSTSQALNKDSALINAEQHAIRKAERERKAKERMQQRKNAREKAKREFEQQRTNKANKDDDK